MCKSGHGFPLMSKEIILGSKKYEKIGRKSNKV
jgi:hypothetical protein